jgi:hypothetical protein
MGKSKHRPGSGSSNSDRKSGKAFKQNPKQSDHGKTGRTVDGYSPSKLAIRAEKRFNVAE